MLITEVQSSYWQRNLYFFWFWSLFFHYATNFYFCNYFLFQLTFFSNWQKCHWKVMVSCQFRYAVKDGVGGYTIVGYCNFDRHGVFISNLYRKYCCMFFSMHWASFWVYTKTKIGWHARRPTPPKCFAIRVFTRPLWYLQRLWYI